VILGTAGHIDHGKTTLVRALTGVNTDRLPEEKRRGITIELGFAPLELEGVGVVGVVDVPGHEAFVRTMVAGATGIDLALVVIAADEGVMPQTREHLAILELLGVRHGVVALTKSDLVDEEWIALVEEDVRAATRRALPDAPIVATSAVSGRGIAEVRNALGTLAREVPQRASNDVFRMPVDRAFTIRGTGTVVTGTVWTGRVERDENVRILPGPLTVRVRGIQGHGAQIGAAVPGGRTAIALAGVEVADVPRGSTLVSDREWHPTTLVRADVSLVGASPPIIHPRTWFRLHIGTSEVGARIVARDIPESGVFAARVVLDAPVIARAGDRFVVRTSAPLNTVAGGIVVDPYAPKRARAWPVDVSDAGRLELLLAESGRAGLARTTLPVRLGVAPDRVASLVGGSGAVVTSSRLASGDVVAILGQEATRLVAGYHTQEPLEPGIPTQLLRSRLDAEPEIVEVALNGEISAGRLTATAGFVLAPGWIPQPTVEQSSLLQTIVSQLEASGVEPPSVGELSANIGADAGILLRYLERQRQVIQVEQDRYYTPVHLESLVDQLKSGMASGAELGPSELREVLGLSRKYLIPFLEYCDRAGYTVRGATGRLWRGP
jgi:selenocysteine-specific elongation factor